MPEYATVPMRRLGEASKRPCTWPIRCRELAVLLIRKPALEPPLPGPDEVFLCKEHAIHMLAKMGVPVNLVVA